MTPASPQLELTLPPRRAVSAIPRARRTDPATSHAAARSMREAAATQRALIVALLQRAPATADEVDAALSWRPTTAGRRLAELERLGQVERTPTTRTTRSGRLAHVYKAVA